MRAAVSLPSAGPGPFVAYAELIGGILLILGAFTSVVGLLLAAEMIVAALLVHLPMGVFVDNGGWELVGALGAGALLLAAVGAGRLSVVRRLHRPTPGAPRPGGATPAAAGDRAPARR